MSVYRVWCKFGKGMSHTECEHNCYNSKKQCKAYFDLDYFPMTFQEASRHFHELTIY